MLTFSPALLCHYLCFASKQKFIAPPTVPTMATFRSPLGSPLGSSLIRRRISVAPRELIARLEQETDEAELRYQMGKRDRRIHQPRLTYDRMKITTVIHFKKNKGLHDVLKTWWRFKRVISMDQERQKRALLSMAVIAHFLRRNKRGAKLHSGLAKVMALVLVPFMVPPAIVLGVPVLVLFLPCFILLWAILTLNRAAKKVLLQNRRVQKQPSKGSFSKHLSSMLSFSEVPSSKSKSMRTRKQANNSMHVGNRNSTDESSHGTETTYTDTTEVASATATTSSRPGTKSLRVVTFAPPGTASAAKTTPTSNQLTTMNKSYFVRPRKSWIVRSTSLARRRSCAC
jgi:hypothetical protein